MKKNIDLNFSILVLVLFFSIIFYSGCGDKADEKKEADSEVLNNESGLSDFELAHGIGPITEVIRLSEIDKNLSAKGEKIFVEKCAACHKLDERYVGPAQRNVLERRSPEFVMNMVLNPEENYQKHPEIKKLFAEYMTPMPNQNLTMEDARAVLEYFRIINP